MPADLTPDGPTTRSTSIQATAAAPGFVGPVPDFSPLAGIVVHSYLRDACPPLWSALYSRLGPALDVNASGVNPRSTINTSMAWMRDYHPQYVRDAAGSLEVVHFLSVDRDRDRFPGEAVTYGGGPSPDQWLYHVPGKSNARWLGHEDAPILLESGNLVSTGKHVFCTTRLFEANQEPHPELTAEGYKPRSDDEVLDVLSHALHVDRRQIVVLPRMPGEPCGHADMFLMALGPDKVLIPQIRDEALGVISYPNEQALGRVVQAFLDERAQQLAALGYEVERLPMMAPINLQPEPGSTQTDDPKHVVAMSYSPTNSLLADLAGTPAARSAFLPDFAAQGFPPAYQALQQGYESEWKAFFTREGWSPQSVDASSLANAHGLFRCLSFPIPA